ncbi:MAG: hypothetical protein WKF78_13385 [Candidatus Limnocylindrales bacterium]
MTRPTPTAYTPRDVEGAIYERWLAADVFAPDGAGSTRGPGPAAVHDRPAAAEHHRLAPPGPRPDARPSRTCWSATPGCAATPTLFLPGLDHAVDRRPVRARRDHRQGGRESRESLGRERYLERMCALRRRARAR